MRKKSKIVLLIGAPSTGKTSVLNFLIAKGYHCFEEISRQVVQDARKEGYSHLFKEKPLLFSEKLLKGRKEQYEIAQNMEEDFVFIDRGLPDITAYLDMNQIEYPEEFDKANMDFIYDYIFLFPLWRDIYLSDEERYEDFELSREIEEHLKKSYNNLNYDLIKVPKTNVEDRVNFILSHLMK